MSVQKPMMPTAGEKYVPFKPVDLKDRRWPNAVITKPPAGTVAVQGLDDVGGDVALDQHVEAAALDRLAPVGDLVGEAQVGVVQVAARPQHTAHFAEAAIE